MNNPKTQVGGQHYNDMKIQPVVFIMENNLSYCQGNVIKYVCRYLDKNGAQDLVKAKQYIDFMLTELKNSAMEEYEEEYKPKRPPLGTCMEGETHKERIAREKAEMLESLAQSAASFNPQEND